MVRAPLRDVAEPVVETEGVGGEPTGATPGEAVVAPADVGSSLQEALVVPGPQQKERVQGLETLEDEVASLRASLQTALAGR